MTIALGADHRGFELKNQIRTALEEQGHTVIDCGATEYDAEDDFPSFGAAVAREIQKNPEQVFGVVLCGSGIGVSIAANRFTGVRCGLIFDEDQVEHARKNDHINAISIPSDYIPLERALRFIELLITTETAPKDKYLRRCAQLDALPA